jgi:CHAT domain-containing protein
MTTMRYSAGQLTTHQSQLIRRAQYHLCQLYAALISPIEAHLGTRRLIFVPHGPLHSLPFHALFDGETYLIERHEICVVPSAAVLQRCLAQPLHSWERALLVGCPDLQAPYVRAEVQQLAQLFPDSIVLLDEQAVLPTLRAQASQASLVHLACHGQFRGDNPLFSALRLSDGWLTVRDAYSLTLNCGLVTLSACETGINAVAPGDELMGLARGFFSAGAPSLLVSLWTVDDVFTASFMEQFYTHLLAGERPAAALRSAQRSMLLAYPHPYYWSPFLLLGRW